MPLPFTNKQQQLQQPKPPKSPFFHPHTPQRRPPQRDDSESAPTQNNFDNADSVVKEAKSSLTGCAANLVNAIVGSGIVGIPFAVQQAGFVFGILLILVCAILTDKSLRLLVATAKHAHTASYETVMEAAFGVAGFRFIAINMFVMAYGAMLSYLMIIKDSYASLAGWTQPEQKRAVLWFLSLTVLMPLACQRDMANLAWTSRVSVVMDTILVLLVAYQGTQEPDRMDFPSWQTLSTDSNYWLNPSTVFVGLGVLSFAFVCQHSAFLIAGSLEKPTIKRWSTATHAALILCFFLACTSGIGGYLGYANGVVQGNILNNLPQHSWPGSVARAMLGSTMLCVYPLESFVARHVCVALLFQGRRAHEGNADADLLDRSDRRVGLTVALFLLAVIPASLFENLGNVLAFTGAIGGSCLSYIGPGIVYLGIHGERFWELLQESRLLGKVARKFAQREQDERNQLRQQMVQLAIPGGGAQETTPLVAQGSSNKNTTSTTTAMSEPFAAVSTPTPARSDPTATSTWTDCLQESLQTALWYALGMPVWCAIASYGKAGLHQHMHDLALKTPYPLRIGDVEYKKEFHRVIVTRSPSASRSSSFQDLMQHQHSFQSLNLQHKGSINQQIGQQLLGQKQQKNQTQSGSSITKKQESEPLEPDPQENPTWYDFIVAIAFCIFGVIALVAGLLSLAVEEEEKAAAAAAAAAAVGQ